MKEVLYMPIKGEILSASICELELSVRATHALNKTGIETISDFMSFGPVRLCRVKNLGKKTIYEIVSAIQKLVEDKCKDIEEVFIERQNSECSKTDDPILPFEEQIKTSFDEKLLMIPIEELNLPARAFNGLKNAGLETIKDVVDFGFHALMTKKNVGRKTVTDIKNAIWELQKTQIDKKAETSLVNVFGSIISSIAAKYLPIIEARFGYDGKCKTLEEIGSSIGITRERVRQIIDKAMRQITHRKRKEEMQALIENIEKILFQYKGVVSFSDMAKDVYFISGDRKQLRFIINLIVEMHKERYRVVDKYFLTNLSDDEIDMFQYKFREIALRYRFPIDEKALLENILSVSGTISKDYLSYCLLYKDHAKISKGKILYIGRLSLPEKAKLLLSDVDRPVHFTEIASLYKERYGDSTAKKSTLEHAIHARIGDSKDFIIVGPGTFLLREKFKVPDNINEIVAVSKEILIDVKSISDTKFLINELCKRNINIGNLNAYSLKRILIEHPGFISYRKFEIGIEGLADKHERKPLNALILDILSSVGTPLHTKKIWKELQKQRGFPEYAIAQRLADDQNFIRVAPATYTISKNIIHYEEKRTIIISFAKDWITFKNAPISSFFVSVVLKETEKIKDLSLGLVEHILATCPEFICLSNGFYDLVENKYDA